MAPKPQPSKAEQIIALVRGGRLVNQGDGALVFSKSGLTRSFTVGLYEDAILLARLRRSLKETAGVPESVSAGATVRDARAFLEIDEPASSDGGKRDRRGSALPGSSRFRRERAIGVLQSLADTLCDRLDHLHTGIPLVICRYDDPGRMVKEVFSKRSSVFVVLVPMILLRQSSSLIFQCL